MITGKQRRLGALFGEDEKTFLVAVDHSVTTGPANGLGDMRSVLRSVVAGGADGVVTHRGTAVRDMPVQRGTALIVHLSGSTALSEESDLKVRVCDPETAMALGADAVSAHITLGCGHREDRDALADLRNVVRSCDVLGMPLMVMTYVRHGADDPARAIVHAARVAAELGADVVKAAHPGDKHLGELVASTSVPVVLAGGAADCGWDEFLESAKRAIGTGVAGVCVGRRVFGSSTPERAAAALRAVVHGEVTQPTATPPAADFTTAH